MEAHDATEPTLLRVFLIDGNSGDRGSLARSIRSCAAVELNAFEAVDEALQHIDAVRALPHVIFADLAVRGIPAPEMMHWVRYRADFVSVWLVALTADLRSVRAPYCYGADALLVKPVFADDLAAVLTLAANARSRVCPVSPV